MLDTYQAQGYVVRRFSLGAASRVVVGLGAESVLETSICLHRIYGFPIIPGSALKGLARAYARLVKGKHEGDPLFADIFGKGPPEARAGKVIFFDAIPANPANLKLELDVMSPHYAPYYQGSEPPADYHNPIPIFFLTVAPGSEFLFAMASRDKNLVSWAEEYLTKGLTELGIGAKTTAGYGLWRASKLRLITFLGKSEYKEARYIFNSEIKCICNSSERKTIESEPTRFFPEAIVQCLHIKEILLLATQEALKGSNFERIPDYLKEKLKVITIPEGKKESELWETFDFIVSEVEENDEIVLDITHGFRSIPMIVFSVADYLRKTKSVVIRYILYGAYDAGSAESPGGIRRALVFDLTPLLDLIEWTGGLEAFLRRGEGILIGEKMQDKQRSLYRQRDLHPSLPQKLQSVGQKLETLSLSLHLARPKEVLKDAHDLLNLLTEAKNELSKWAKPFAAIVDRVQKELEAFAYGDAGKLTRENLGKQLALLEYYIGKGLMIQAVLLAREWMVSYVIYLSYVECGDWTAREKREQAEKRLNDNTGDLPNGSSTDRGIELSRELLECWKSLADLRNDLAHCGMRENPRPANNIKSKLENIVHKLRDIYIKYTRT